MKTLYRSLLLVLPVLFATCDENEIPSRDYPRLNTLDVTNVNEAGATLNAEITYRGDFEILRYGFVWSESESPTLQNSDRVIFQRDIRSNKFSATISSTLVSRKEYYVRPFVQTEDYFVYGKNVKFTSRGSEPPVITDFFPTVGSIGDTITITGEGFGYIPGVNTVTFNSTEAKVVRATDTLLRVIVPEELSAIQSSITVEIVGKKVIADQKFDLKIPRLLSAEATTINVCETIIFNIANVGPGSVPRIYFNGKIAQIVGILEDQIKVLVPFILPNDLTVEVKLVLGAFQSTMPGTLNLNPNRFRLEPERSSFLDTITMYFTNMQHCLGFDLQVEGKILQELEETDQYIRAILPASLNDAWRVKLQVLSGSEVVLDTIYYRTLNVESIIPSAVSPGETVVIKGRGFHPVLARNIVCFDCRGTGFGTHGEIIGGDIHTLIVKVPSMPSGPTYVHLFTQNLGTFGTPFEVK